MTRPVLITGAAALWSAGASVRDLAQQVLEGRHALGKLARLRAEDGSDLFRGVVEDRVLDDAIEKSKRRGMDRFGRLNVAGATASVRDAGYTPEAIAGGALADAGLVLSTTFGTWESTNRFVCELIDEGPLGTSARTSWTSFSGAASPLRRGRRSRPCRASA